MIVEHTRSVIVEDSVRLKHSDVVRKYQDTTEEMTFTADWFTGNIPFWIEAFQSLDKQTRARARILEIGSFEGRSTIFFASTFGASTIDCVDTWLGSDEHESAERLNSLYDRFIANTSTYSANIVAHKMTSAEFFIASISDKYDLVYVDGSHRASDVLLDLVEGFNRLNTNGILMIDDYLWKHYERGQNNPCIAVNYFCRIYRGQFKFLRVGYQVYLQKTIT
jgi:predicted O-methyltransferase YrrM